MNPFVLKTGLHKIKPHSRLTGFFILIALVTAPLVFALVFSESMMNGIIQKYVCLSDGHVQTAQDVSAVPSSFIYSSDPVISGDVIIYSASETASLHIKGVNEAYFNEMRLSHIHFSEEDNSDSNLSGISISRTTAEKLGVSVGDKVALMAVRDSSSKAVRPVLLRVNSIYRTGYDALDSSMAYVSYSYARSLFTSSSAVNEILLMPSYADAPYLIREYLDNPYDITYWTDQNSAVYENFVSSRQMIMIILLLVVFVAAFYTAGVANQITEDDMREISISKLLGASDSQIRRSVFISVYTVNAAGITAGSLFGLLLSYNISPLMTSLSEAGIESLSFYLLDFDITVPVLSVVLLLLSLLLISFISINLSLRRTRKITPVQLFTSL